MPARALALALLLVVLPALLGADDARLPKLVVLELKVNGKAIALDVAMTLTGMIRQRTVKAIGNRGKLLSKDKVFEILKQAGKSADKCTGECEVQTARELGAEYAVTGEVNPLGNKAVVVLEIKRSRDGVTVASERLKAPPAELDEKLDATVDALVAQWLGSLDEPTAAKAAEKPGIEPNVGAGGKLPPRGDVSPGMVLIPAGTFWMGCNAAKDSSCQDNEKPQHKVTLSAYYMDLTETTVGQYKACVDAGVCTAPSAAQPADHATYPGLRNNPVNNVTWTQAQQYCQWRGVGFDLPTEAQWEMAARGSCEKNGSAADDAGCAAAMRTYPWGEAVASASYAVMTGSWATAAVGSKPAGDSPYGLHDMAGNVWEWSRDWYGEKYYSSSPATDPLNSVSDSYRVGRGGSRYIDAVSLRAGFRTYDTPSDADDYLGMRCMRSSP